jgi:hypothetical protein
MLAYLLYLLQPLDVACFALLKHRYSNMILGLAHNCTSYISKETFLPAFKTTFKQPITKENIKAGFRGASLVLYNLQAMLSKLNIVVQTPKLLLC